MTEFYNELYILPSALDELFADFILDYTKEAIEELPIKDIPKNLYFSHFISSQNTTSGTSIGPLDQSAILVRSNLELDSLVAALKDFSILLSKRMESSIDFKYAMLKKKNEDWIEKYRQSIEPLCIGDFYIRPSWRAPLADSKFVSMANREIVINPALAFGSGHHATTSMCIEMLSKIDLSDKKLLDVGCGSGILALVARMCGAKVSLCDTDLLAIEESKKNFMNNAKEIEEIWQGSIMPSKGSYDVIVANILADIIKILYNDFYQATRQSSILILSGILDIYESGVLECFKGFKLIERLQKDEWVALKLIKI